MSQVQLDARTSVASTAEPGVRRLRTLVGRTPWQYFVVPAALLVLWEILVKIGVLDARLVPAPHTVAETWWHWVAGSSNDVGADQYYGTWFSAAQASGYRVIVGFLIAALGGTAVGLLIGWYRLPRMLLQPVIDILRPIPVTAWIPFAVVFFGIKPASAISLIVLGAFFPIALNAMAGAQGTPPVLVAAARMLGTSERKILWRVVLPSALPPIVTGLRVGMALAWVLVIVSEMVAVKSGLGFSLWDAYYFGRTDVIVAAMFSVGLLGYMSDQILVRIVNRAMQWTPDVR